MPNVGVGQIRLYGHMVQLIMLYTSPIRYNILVHLKKEEEQTISGICSKEIITLKPTYRTVSDYCPFATRSSCSRKTSLNGLGWQKVGNC